MAENKNISPEEMEEEILENEEINDSVLNVIIKIRGKTKGKYIIVPIKIKP